MLSASLNTGSVIARTWGIRDRASSRVNVRAMEPPMLHDKGAQTHRLEYRVGSGTPGGGVLGGPAAPPKG